MFRGILGGKKKNGLSAKQKTQERTNLVASYQALKASAPENKDIDARVAKLNGIKKLKTEHITAARKELAELQAAQERQKAARETEAKQKAEEEAQAKLKTEKEEQERQNAAREAEAKLKAEKEAEQAKLKAAEQERQKAARETEAKLKTGQNTSSAPIKFATFDKPAHMNAQTNLNLKETSAKEEKYLPITIGSLVVGPHFLFADKNAALEELKHYATQLDSKDTEDKKCIILIQEIMRQSIEAVERGNTASPLPSLLDEIYFDLLQKINAENHSDGYALYLRYCESSLKYYSLKAIAPDQKDEHQALVRLAKQTLEAVKLSKQKATREEFSDYVEILWRSKRAIEKIDSPTNSSNDDNTQKIGALAIKAMNHKTRWGMLIGSLAFAMVGVLLIIASKMLLNATLGASAPVSMIGYTVGKGMISENIPVIGFCIGGLMTAVGLGLATATYGSTPVPFPTLVSTAACAFHKELARKNDAAKAKPPVQEIRRNSLGSG